MTCFEWHFDAHNTPITTTQFKASPPDTNLLSDPFDVDGYIFRIMISTVTHSINQSALYQCKFWLCWDQLPDGIDTLRASVRFVCDEIGYDTTKPVESNKQSTNYRNIFWCADLDKFSNLDSWTIKCFITIHRPPPTISDPTYMEFGQFVQDGIRDMLNVGEYNKNMRWLLLIWKNVMEHPDDGQYRVITHEEIKHKLKKEKYVKMFEGILMWSGFDRDANNDYNQWIYNEQLQIRTIMIAAFWSFMMKKWEESRIEELVDDGFTVEEAKYAINASMSDSEEEAEQDLMNALIQELVNDGHTIEDAKYAIIASYKNEEDEHKDDEKGEWNECKDDEYKTWFDDILELPQYYERFIQNNYKDLSYLDDDIDEDELINDLLITNRSHRKKILLEIKKLVQTKKVPYPAKSASKMSDQFVTEIASKEDVNFGFIDSAYLLKTCNVYDGNKCEFKVKECKHIYQIKNVLKKYNLYIKYKQKHIDDIYDKHYNDIDLLNDFHHLLFNHCNEFEDIHNILASNDKCKLSECLLIRRNRRNRNIDDKNAYFNIDQHSIIRQQLFDRIHSYYYHSFDTGHKFTEKEKQCILSSESKTNDDGKQDLNHSLKIMKNLNQEKKKKLYAEIPELKESITDKFTVNVDNNNKSENQYSFGFRYFYWRWYKDNHLKVDNVLKDSGNFNFAANIGWRLSDWYIPKKYKDIRDELLQNGIGISRYNQLWEKATLTVISNACKQMKCVRRNSELYYEIPTGSQIGINHIMAMMAYCNQDNLQCKFTATYRFIDELETAAKLKERHRNYYHLGRYLRECIECFGMERRNWSITVYHGINRHYTFSSINAFINGPLSTTLDYAVAINFANNTGMILSIDVNSYNWAINRSQDIDEWKLSCFDCHWLSDYPNEQEIFFIGGAAYFSFETILDVPNNIDYQSYVKGIRQMTFCMNNGANNYDWHNYAKNKQEKQLVFRLLSHQIWRVSKHEKGYEFESCPEYIKHILHQHCKNIIVINLRKQFLQKSNVHKKLLINEQGWITLDLIMQLFPNTRTIFCDGSDGDVTCIDPRIIVDSIRTLLKENKEMRLEEIDITISLKWCREMRNVTDLYSNELFDEYKWIVWYREIDIDETEKNSKEKTMSFPTVIVTVRNTNEMSTLF